MANSEPIASGQRPAPAPPAWLGVTLPVWIKVLARYRFPVSAARFSRFLLPTLVAPLNSLAAAVQTLRFGRRIAALEIDPPPVFIIGFLRTGTTLLHELLALDPRHTAPNMYQCMAPKHFLATEPLVRPFLAGKVPSRRPMDNMDQGLDRPFEDEFAQCLSGHDSPYMFLFFPRNAGRAAAAGDTPARAHWNATFVRFLKSVLVARPGRLILKSPPHTARIPALAELFPEARFIHLVRNPLGVIPSAIHTVRVLIEVYGLQRAAAADIEGWVFRNFEQMHRSLDENRRLLTPDRYLEIRYESLTSNPVAELDQIYSRLVLGDFAPARPAVEEYLASAANYRTNRFDVDAGLRQRIVDRCGWVMDRYGYSHAGTQGGAPVKA